MPYHIKASCQVSEQTGEWFVENVNFGLFLVYFGLNYAPNPTRKPNPNLPVTLTLPVALPLPLTPEILKIFKIQHHIPIPHPQISQHGNFHDQRSMLILGR